MENVISLNQKNKVSLSIFHSKSTFCYHSLSHLFLIISQNFQCILSKLQRYQNNHKHIIIYCGAVSGILSGAVVQNIIIQCNFFIRYLHCIQTCLTYIIIAVVLQNIIPFNNVLEKFYQSTRLLIFFKKNQAVYQTASFWK